jgi:hypothetical protein
MGFIDGNRTQETRTGHSTETAGYPTRAEARGNSSRQGRPAKGNAANGALTLRLRFGLWLGLGHLAGLAVAAGARAVLQLRGSSQFIFGLAYRVVARANVLGDRPVRSLPDSLSSSAARATPSNPMSYLRLPMDRGLTALRRCPTKEHGDGEVFGDRGQGDLRFDCRCRPEAGHEASHAIGADHLAPVTLGEIAVGLDLGFLRRLQDGAGLGFDALDLAALPMAIGSVWDRGAVGGVGANLAGNYFPSSTVFIGLGKAWFYWVSDTDLDTTGIFGPLKPPDGVFALTTPTSMGI